MAQPAAQTPARVVTKADLWQQASRRELLDALAGILARGTTVDEVIAILDAMAEERPAQTLDLARDVGRSGPEAAQLMAALAVAWTRRNPAAAWAWAEENSDRLTPEGQTPLTCAVAAEIARRHPEGAVALADALLDHATETRARADCAAIVHAVLAELVSAGHADLAQATLDRWAREPAVSELHGDDFELLAETRDSTSTPAFAEWLAALPASAARDEALVRLARPWAERDPTAAAAWVAQLSDAQVRTVVTTALREPAVRPRAR